MLECARPVGHARQAATALRGKGVAFAIHEGWGQDELGIWTAPDGSNKVAFFADPDGNLLLIVQV
jgi:hypothetical protein